MVATRPEPFETLRDLQAPVRFEFDERISERTSGGRLEDAISISPRVGELEVAHGRREITVRARGGFRAGIVYRVTLQPVVSDMFGNQLTDPFELVFSTGGEPTPTTLAGEVWDRVTGQGVSGASVQATGLDSLVHQSATGRDGIYAFRYLPGGDFLVSAFEDQNRNQTRDSTEVQGARPISVTANDTVFLDIAVLAPDTLPAVLRRASALDSVTVVVEFDDFLDPDVPVEDVAVTLTREGASAPAIERVLHEADYAASIEVARDSLARLDSITRAQAPPPVEPLPSPDSSGAVPPPDSTTAVVPPPDSAGAVRPPASPGPARPPAQRGPSALTPQTGTRPGLQEGTGRVLPARRLVLLLDGPLELEVEYTVRLAGVVNLAGLRDGGGEAPLVREPTPVDSIGGAAFDSLGMPGVDTLSVPDIDTLSVPGIDTLSVPGIDTPTASRIAPSPTRRFRAGASASPNRRPVRSRARARR